MFYPGSGPLEEVKPYVLLLIVLIVMEYKLQDDLPRDRMCMKLT